MKIGVFFLFLKYILQKYPNWDFKMTMIPREKNRLLPFFKFIFLSHSLFLLSLSLSPLLCSSSGNCSLCAATSPFLWALYLFSKVTLTPHLLNPSSLPLFLSPSLKQLCPKFHVEVHFHVHDFSFSSVIHVGFYQRALFLCSFFSFFSLS